MTVSFTGAKADGHGWARSQTTCGILREWSQLAAIGNHDALQAARRFARAGGKTHCGGGHSFLKGNARHVMPTHDVDEVTREHRVPAMMFVSDGNLNLFHTLSMVFDDLDRAGVPVERERAQVSRDTCAPRRRGSPRNKVLAVGGVRSVVVKNHR